MSLELDEHREYLSDAPRLTAFSRAISEIVQPGQTVVDLGAGTGILGLLACRAGAKRVYSVDAGGMIEVARMLARANDVEDHFVFIKRLSRHTTLPELADVVVADQIGHFGFEAGIVDYFTDARRRLLRPGGVMIPRCLELHVVPLEHSEQWSRVTFWNTTPAGFDVSPASTIATNTGYPLLLQRAHLLGDPAMGLSFDPADPPGEELLVRGRCVVSRDGTLHGIGGWFLAHLSPSVTMTNSPLATDRVGRRNVFFPVEHPVPVEPGMEVHTTIRIRPTEVLVSWQIEVWNAGRCVLASRHSTLKGMLISREDLARTRPDFAPSLTSHGLARLTVLTLCDGMRPLREIEREVYCRHADLFPSPAEAASFVAEVVTRYAQ